MRAQADSAALPDSVALPTSAADLPRPPADVVGGEWSVWLMAAVVVAVLVVAAVGVATWRRWAAARRGGAGAPPLGRSPREEALRELERILSRGRHRNGRVDEFYASSTDALRRFAERLEPRWSTALTSGELVGRMAERWGDDALDELPRAVERAERVKFAGERPGPDAAEDDWRRIRDWIRGAPGGGGP